ncbi:aldehyde dehydrogenase family protein [Kineococcus gynurae]|uniref:Aldehyde dehydrogenase family protein n=1 Tax=Kineococcus gynurae TaxID=452979 RepID=A0ABV5LRN5_9ACTN
MSAQLRKAEEVAPARPPRTRGTRPVDTTEARLPDLCAASDDPGLSPLLDLVSPATGRPLTRVADTDPALALRTLTATASAGRAWAWLSGEDRARHLFAAAQALAEHARGAGLLDTLTTGRPVSTTLAPGALADAAFSAAGWADKLPAVGLRPRSGGAALIRADWRATPADLAENVLVALAAGAGAVVRARPEAAPVALRLREALRAAGLPDGLVAVVPGAFPGTDVALEQAPDTVAVTLDGDAGAVRTLAVRAAARDLPWCGTTDAPAVDLVLTGADLDAVAEAVLARVLGGAQAHPGGNLVLVEDAVAEDLTLRLRAVVEPLTPGDPLLPSTRLGPCPTAALAQAAAACRTRPSAVAVDLAAGGWWALPVVLQLPRRSSPLPPGPVVGVRTVPDEAAARRVLGAVGAVQVWERGGPRHPAGPPRLRRALRWLRTCCG